MSFNVSRRNTNNMNHVLTAVVSMVILLVSYGLHSIGNPLLLFNADTSASATDKINYPDTATVSGSIAQGTRSTVIRIIDGDTIEISDGRKVRYIGVDTPETHDPRTKLECYGKEATEKNRELVAGQEVILVRDISDTDQFGRLLRYVYKGDVFVNDTLVKEGFARASRYPPDVRFAELFRDSEREARENARGLWGSVCAAK